MMIRTRNCSNKGIYEQNLLNFCDNILLNLMIKEWHLYLKRLIRREIDLKIISNLLIMYINKYLYYQLHLKKIKIHYKNYALLLKPY